LFHFWESDQSPTNHLQVSYNMDANVDHNLPKVEAFHEAELTYLNMEPTENNAGVQNYSKHIAQDLHVNDIAEPFHDLSSLPKVVQETQQFDEKLELVDDNITEEKEGAVYQNEEEAKVPIFLEPDGAKRDSFRIELEGRGHREEVDPNKTQTRRDRLGDFEIKKIMGIGAQGIVLKVQDELSRNYYALKRITSTDNFEKEATEREVVLLIALDHKNVTKYEDQWDSESNYAMEFEFYEQLKKEFPDWKSRLDDSFEERYEFDEDSDDGDLPEDKKDEDFNVKYLVMELCREETLVDFMKGQGRPFILNVMKQIAEALVHVHGRGIMHRDLKPDNIYFAINENKVVKVGDFGLGRYIRSDDDNARMTGSVGTRRYMAPEQHGDNKYDEKCDIYSLGIILCDLLCSLDDPREQQHLYSQLKQEDKSTEERVPEDIRKAFPAETELLLDMIKNDPRKRPSAEDVKRRIEDILAL